MSPDAIPQWAIKLTATIGVILVSVIGVATRSLATKTAMVFTSVKVSLALSDADKELY